MTTRLLAEHVTTLDFERVPRPTRETAKRLLLDGIGCLIAGTRGQPAAAASAYAARLQANKASQSTMLITDELVSVRDAAFVNGVTLYSIGVNDIHKNSCSHPGACVIPALLATAEWLHCPGREMIAAMIGSYDVIGRLGRATMPSHRARGFHATGTYGTFGAAAAAGRLLGLDAEAMASAFGVAGSQAAGLVSFQTDGALTMIFHAGRSAQNGVEACLVAEAGIDGPRTVMEDPRGGFIYATSDEPDPLALSRALGVTFDVDDTSFRPFYGCTYTIAASSAAAQIVRRSDDRKAEDIAQVKVRCHSHVQSEVDDVDPRTLLAARLSMQFNIALVLTRGEVVVGDVTDRDLWDPDIRNLLPAVVFELDDSLTHWASEVFVQFKDGAIESALVCSPKGDPANSMNWDDTIHKFRQLLAPVARESRLEEVIRLVRDIEAANGPELMEAVRLAAHDKEARIA
ncbi:hypothetical protein LMG1861_02626 [Achromobacter piechaudii]|uniref:2-methylcitrate dehydratase n=2 Tax=Achromobacter piechaudii TaxID=72556 RepID=A0A6S7D609_9BURK|nr:hypothetical protein LMG1861_02626 [Achromobacter piechaudii]